MALFCGVALLGVVVTGRYYTAALSQHTKVCFANAPLRRTRASTTLFATRKEINTPKSIVKTPSQTAETTTTTTRRQQQKVAKPQRQRPKGEGRASQGKRRGDVVRGLVDPDAPPGETPPRYQDDALLPMVRHIAHAADMRKATDVAAYYVRPCTDVTSFVVAANGRSRPQNDAIAAAVVEDVRDAFGREPMHVEGGADGGWTVLDYGDVIVHVMTPLSRDYYDLDAIWRRQSAPRVDLDDVLTPELPTERFVDDASSSFFETADHEFKKEPRSLLDDDDERPLADEDLLDDWDDDFLDDGDSVLLADIQTAIDAEASSDEDEEDADKSNKGG